MKLLFICTANLQRSPTAENLFSEHETKSAGIHPLAHTKVTKQAITWADKIFCMETQHKKFLLENFPSSKGKIIVLNIPDIYERDNLELINILKQKVSKYL